MIRLVSISTFVALWSVTSFLVAGEPAKVTVIAKNVHCDRCVAAVRASLNQLNGIRFDADDIREGERRRYFSDSFVIQIADTEQTSIGSVAKAVAEADSPHGDDLPLRLNLVLFTSGAIDEDSVVALRSELSNVNGVEVNVPGGLGGFPDKGYFWVQLEPAGGADLKEIFTAAKRAANVTLTTE